MLAILPEPKAEHYLKVAEDEARKIVRLRAVYIPAATSDKPKSDPLKSAPTKRS